MFRARGYANSDTYPGGAWFICDRCSQRRRRRDMLTEWTGLKVDAKCLDPRPPQMMPPNVYPEGIPFFDARVPQDRPDRMEDDTALQSVTGGFAVQYGRSYPGGQNQVPGSISPLPVYETTAAVDSGETLTTEDGFDLTTEDGVSLEVTSLGVPYGPDVLADDVTFITGPVYAPDNT